MFKEDYYEEKALDEEYYNSYNDLKVHEVMLRDKPRMDFYQSVLSESRLKGKIVVDVGAGSGILSFWAARSQAVHVFSIEASGLSSMIGKVAEDNGLQHVVHSVASTVEALVELGPEAFVETYAFLRESSGINVVVSEWMGFFLFHEGMLSSVLEARDFFRSVNHLLGVAAEIELIPAEGELFVAPISLNRYVEEKLQCWKSVGGVDLSRLFRSSYEDLVDAGNPLIDCIPESCLLHEGMPIWHGTFSEMTKEEANCVAAERAFWFHDSENFIRELKCSPDGKVSVDGFVLWFKVYDSTLTLDTSPASSPTHWKQATTLLPKECRQNRVVSFASADDSISLNIVIKRDTQSERCYTICTEIM